VGHKLAKLNSRLTEFIEKQRVFFVATAAADGRVNVSPKGMDTLRVLGDNRVIWLNLTGSGNETATHLLVRNRITLMFCAFEGTPLILRLYGTAEVFHPRDPQWEDLLAYFPPIAGTRQIFDVHVDLVRTSCGMAVPFYDFVGDRNELKEWAEGKGEQGLREYWEKKNLVSIDGQPTKIFPISVE